MNSLLHDFYRQARIAMRALLKRPVYASCILFSLAIGTGVTSGIYAIIDHTLLRPIPGRQSKHVYVIRSDNAVSKMVNHGLNSSDLSALMSQSNLFNALVWFDSTTLKWNRDGFVDVINGAAVPSHFFDFWKVAPKLGRAFYLNEGKGDREKRVLVSESFWRAELGGDTNIVGSVVKFGEDHVTVIGVVPSYFQFPYANTPFWLLANTLDAALYEPSGAEGEFWPRNYVVALRARDENAARQVLTALTAMNARQSLAFPELTSGWRFRLERADAYFAHPSLRDAKWPLVTLISVVLAICALNCVYLAQTRAIEAKREFAVKLSLGASRGQLFVTILWEFVLLAIGATALSVLVSYSVVQTIVSSVEAFGIRVPPTSLELFGRGLTVSVVAALVVSLLSTLQVSRCSLNKLLNESGKGISLSASSGKLISGLIVAELGVALVLLSGASLMMRSISNLQKRDLGMEPHRLTSLEVELPWEARYQNQEFMSSFANRVMIELKTLPGSVNAGAMIGPFMGKEVTTPDNKFFREVAIAGVSTGTENLFMTLGAELIEGRFLGTHDRGSGRVLVNVTLARLFWPNVSAIGRQLRLVDSRAGAEPTILEVIGVVRDFRHASRTDALIPTYYLPIEDCATLGTPIFFLRNPRPLISLRSELQKVVSSIVPDCQSPRLASVDATIKESVAPHFKYTIYITIIAATGLAVASIGTFAMLSRLVNQRRNEIGVRMALGASRADIQKLVLFKGARILACGVGLGFCGSLALSMVLKSYLYGIVGFDLLSFAIAATTLAIFGTAASWIPAVRAARTEPVQVIREF